MLKGLFQNLLINRICPNLLMFLQGDDVYCPLQWPPRGGLLWGGFSGGGCLFWGVCLFWIGCLLWEGVSAPGGVCSGGVCSEGVSALGGCLLRGGACLLLGGFCSGGCLPDTPVNRMTDRCKKHYLAATNLQTVQGWNQDSFKTALINISLTTYW